MLKTFKKRKRASAIYAVITFVVLLVITQLLVYQRYEAIRENELNELSHEVDDTRDQLKVILNHNLSSAQTVSIMYKQNRTLTWFDSVAKELLDMNEAIDIVYFVDKDLVISRIYPLEGSERLLGFNLLSDPYRRAEAKLALGKSNIVFGGPYELLQGGGKAIAGRVPLFENGKFIGGGVVVTKLSTIQKRMPELENKGNQFVYRLAKKNTLTGKTEYFFDGYHPQKNWVDSLYMPRADWMLYTAYADGYISHKTIILLSIFGLLFSVMGAVFIYSKTYAPVHLEETVKNQTQTLSERMKELSAIYNVSEVLRDERQSIDIAMSRIVKMLAVGWQHPEICAARIVIGDQEYKTENYKDTPYKLQVPLKLYDDRQGYVEVSYTEKSCGEDEEPFLEEERALINTLADAVEVYYNNKLQRDKVSRSEATLRSLVEACPVGVILCDTEFRIVAINSSMATNYPVNTGRNIGVGDNFIDVLLPERREYVTNVFKTVMENMEPVAYETNYPKESGTVYFEVNVAPVVVGGEAIGVCLVGIDVSSRKKLELGHEQVIRDLMQHMTTLVEFARALNDKVRAPLAEIPRQADRAKAEKDEKQRGVILDEISGNAQYVAGFVARLDESVSEKR